jgi:hypothetical protein
MITPDVFNTSLTDAEQAAFDILMDATQTEQDKTAYLGYEPEIINTWYFEATFTALPEVSFYYANVDSTVVKCRARCTYFNRADCQKWFMAIMAKLPKKEEDESNIKIFRLSQDFEIKTGIITLKNEKNDVRIFSKEIEFDLEFLTGGKDTAL